MKKKFVALLVAVPLLLTGAIVAPAVANNAAPEAAPLPQRVLNESVDPDWDGISTTIENQMGSSPTTTTTWPANNRISGSDRWVSAVASSQFLNRPAGRPVFIVNGTDFPDSLAAGPAASVTGGTLLITDPASLPAPIQTEIVRLAPTQIYVIGGVNSVSANVISQLQSARPGATVTRIDGADRFETAANIANRFFPGQQQRLAIVNGYDYQSALAVSAVASRPGQQFPVLLGWSGGLTSPTVSAVDRMNPQNTYIVGMAANIHAGVDAQVNSLGGTNAHRLNVSTVDYAATSVTIYQALIDPNAEVQPVVYNSGAAFADLIVASNITARTGGSLLLTNSQTCSPASILGITNTEVLNYRFIIGGAFQDAALTTSC